MVVSGGAGLREMGFEATRWTIEGSDPKRYDLYARFVGHVGQDGAT